MKQYLLGTTLVSLVLSALFGTAVSAKIYEKPLRLVMPSAEEFILMSHEQRVEVISAIQEFVKKVEAKQPPMYGEFRSVPLRRLFVEEAFAGYFKAGDSCIIGGYKSLVEKRSAWLGCIVPEFEGWWARGMNEQFKCDPKGAKKILCNPLVFGYPAADGSGCQTIAGDLTKKCGNSSKSPDEVARDLIKKLTEGGREIDPESDAWKQLMNGFKDLTDHCGTAGKKGGYNETECDVLMGRVTPVRDALQSAYKKQQSAKPIVTKCPVNSEKWTGIEISSTADGKSKVSVIPKTGSVRTLEMATPKAGDPLTVEVPASGSDPALTLKADAGLKTCSVSEKVTATAAPAPPPYEPCTGDEKEGWKEKCNFVDARTLCRQDDKTVRAMTTMWTRSEQRKFGPQGLIDGKPELGKLIKDKHVQATLLHPTEEIVVNKVKVVKSELSDQFSASLDNLVSSKGVRDMSDFSGQLKAIEDRCFALNKSGGIEENPSKDKKKPAKKTKDTFHVVKLNRESDMTMYTCQRIDKDFDPAKPLDPDHIKFSKGLALVVHRGKADSPKEGFVEYGDIDEQGDFVKSTIYRPGSYNPILQRERDPAAKKEKDKHAYKVAGLNVCPDTVEGSKPVQYKVYTKGTSVAVCSPDEKGKIAPSADLHGNSVEGDSVKVQSVDNKYVIRTGKPGSKTCELYSGNRRIPTVQDAKSSPSAAEPTEGL